MTALIKAKKSLGQNFLTDHRVARQIIDSVSPRAEDVIIEIGPGTGALTAMLVRRTGHVVAIEIDASLVEELRRTVRARNLSIVNTDVLKLDWEQTIEDARSRIVDVASTRVRVVANLPYYISTPIIERLLSPGRGLFDMTLMLQREVADRIVSEPGNRAYGYLSVMVQYYALASKLFDVPPSSFTPSPKVWSAVIKLVVRERPAVEVADEAMFFALVRAAFAQRRKTIRNNLKAAAAALEFGSPVESALEAASIDPRRRAETLSLIEFAELCRQLN
ncbi:MAG TPA: 16S rRNA (adenine(1518)-N(6)/adenine(1519)-N(6))-dimethyltransferase RsmA [Blastocatellia bacterium]|nr:16S rRNA (adenine(1518)-N(6)/adenine(1519)-N(6))-dimethyltransferase RsmA [Blastocatellia bacterium]